jgi:hypothetical protein
MQMNTKRRTNNRSAVRWIAAAMLILATSPSGAPLIADDKPPAISHDGLHLVPGSEVAAAWVKPEAVFSGYGKS